MTSVRKLYVLLCGYEVLPKTVSTKDRGADFILSEPISVYLLDTDSGWIMIDAGVDPAHVRADARDRMFFDHGIYPPIILPQHELDSHLATLGLTRQDISHGVLTHLHYDHAGCVKYFPHAKVSVQRREYDNWFGRGHIEAMFPEDLDVPTIQWNLVDGDWEVAPGLTMIDTRGHTAGHQSAVVELKTTGVVVLPIDAGDLQENCDDEVLPGGSVDDEAAMAAILRIKRIVAERDATLILFHDPVAIQKTRLAPSYYD